jgi:hypothetical protein
MNRLRGGQFISPHAQVKAAAAAISFLSVSRCRYPLHAIKGFAADQALIQSRGILCCNVPTPCFLTTYLCAS